MRKSGRALSFQAPECSAVGDGRNKAIQRKRGYGRKKLFGVSLLFPTPTLSLSLSLPPVSLHELTRLWNGRGENGFLLLLCVGTPCPSKPRETGGYGPSARAASSSPIAPMESEERKGEGSSLQPVLMNINYPPLSSLLSSSSSPGAGRLFLVPGSGLALLNICTAGTLMHVLLRRKIIMGKYCLLPSLIGSQHLGVRARRRAEKERRSLSVCLPF